jgi:uncharacterized protein (TIGR02757 family)
VSTIQRKLEAVYQYYNRRIYVDPDPLLFLYAYPEVRDREIAGIVAACLAYGRVEMIMKTVGRVLEKMGPSPVDFLNNTKEGDIDAVFTGFKYRFATDVHLSNLLKGIKGTIGEFGSLERCFSVGAGGVGGTVLDGLGQLYRRLNQSGPTGHLLADPNKTSACKRSHLFLRWMVRRDAVDPGGWDNVSPGQLIIPLDTHMYKIGTMLGFTRRKSPDKLCAFEITAGFKELLAQDPVKYDFSLTRFGIRRHLDMDQLAHFFSADNLSGGLPGRSANKRTEA